jgi:hypothetical protein
MDLIKNWFKKQITNLMLSIGNVEKNALSQSDNTLDVEVGQHQRHTQGQLADSLVHGEVTEEVLNLKWRTYKILQQTQKVTATVVGYDNDGYPIVSSRKRNLKTALKKVKTDEHDEYPLEMVIINDEISLSANEAIDNDYLNILDETIENYDDKGNLTSVSIAEISGDEFLASNKTERPIKILRDAPPKFYIENFAKKMNVKKITKKKKLIEFYFSKYHNDNKNSKLFINHLSKVLEENKPTTIFDMNGIEFVTYKCIGIEDFLEFNYENIVFDKIIEFNGNYVVKFFADVKLNGKNILEKHKVEELDKKYEQKAKK